MASTNLSKNKQGYGYKYTDLAQIHEYLEQNGMSYYQYIENIDGNDYIYTVPTIDGKEMPPRRGSRVIQATLSGKSNPAQEQGSALTYARRYSLLMAFGLATEDDDGEALTKKPKNAENRSKYLEKICTDHGFTAQDFFKNNGKAYNPNNTVEVEGAIKALELKYGAER